MATFAVTLHGTIWTQNSSKIWFLYVSPELNRCSAEPMQEEEGWVERQGLELRHPESTPTPLTTDMAPGHDQDSFNLSEGTDGAPPAPTVGCLFSSLGFRGSSWLLEVVPQE